MNPEAERIQARLRQIDDYESKGLMRAEEAEAARKAQLHRLMMIVVPDSPAPRVSWRVHVAAIAAMVVLVGAIALYVLSGQAGLNRRSQELLAAGRVAATHDEASRRERLARIQAGQSIAPDQFGRFDRGASAPPASASVDAGSGASSATAALVAAAAKPASGATADAIAPLLSGRIVLDPDYESRVASDDALFVTVRLPDDPTGLPLAQIRVEVSNLPLAFDIGTKELLGSPERFMHAPRVVVSARISKSGSGQPRPGDLVGTSAPVPPWSGNVRLVIDHVVPRP